jgi:hypothetical protein
MIARTLSLILVACSLIPATAQDREPEQKVPPELPANGTELFRGLLHFHKIQPFDPENMPRNQIIMSGQIIVIIYGTPTADAELKLRNYSANPALIAIDHPYNLTRITSQFGYRIATPGLQFFGKAWTPDSLMPEQRPDCPIVSSQPFGLFNLGRQSEADAWNPFAGFARIATNRPASLVAYPTPEWNRVKGRDVTRRGPVAGLAQAADERPANQLHALAYLPPDCKTGGENGRILPNDHVFAVGTGPTNRQFLMADQDVLSNQMLALPDTDNLPFAVKLIKSLKGVSGDQPTYCYFFENGRHVKRFDDVTFSVKPSSDMPPLPFPPPEMIDKLGTQVVDGLADQFDRSDAANSLFNKNQRYYAYLLRLLVLALAGMAILYFARRAFVNRYRNERTAMPVAPLARVKPAKGLVGQMRQDILIGGDYGPVIRDYLREFFAATGLRAGPVDATRAGLPPVQYDGRAENKPALLADLTKLWQTAYGPAVRIPLSAWKELEPMMLRVWRAADAGRWRFAADPRGGA